jgi:branched-chain amino acid transport system substrate-binding protein
MFCLSKRPRSRCRGLAFALVPIFVVAACGGDADDAGDSASATTAAPAASVANSAAPEATSAPDTTESAGTTEAGSPSGEPIVIYQFLPIDTPTLSYPQVNDGAQAAVQSINASGGIQGRPLELVLCDDKMDPAIAAACAQEAVDSDAVGAVGSVGVQGPQIFPILEEANFPSLLATSTNPSDTNSPMAFPLNLGSRVFAAQPALYFNLLDPDPESAVVVISELPGYEARVAFFEDYSERQGVELLDTVLIPANTADLSPIVSAVGAADPDVIYGSMGATDLVKFWPAMASQGLDIPMMTTSTGVSADVIAAGGDAADNTYLIDTYPPVSSDENGVPQFRRDFADHMPDKDLSADALRGWGGVRAFEAYAETIEGEITRESFLDALSTVRGLDVLWWNDLDFTEPGPFADSPRVIVTTVYAYDIEDGEIHDTGVNVDVEP